MAQSLLHRAATGSTMQAFSNTTASPLQSAETDVQLIEALLRNDACAWHEFRVRYDRLIHRCITKVTSRFPNYVTSDDVRDIHGSLLVQLLANNMHKLRLFNPERGNRLSSWIGMLAVNAAYDYLRNIRRDAKSSVVAEEDLVCDHQPDPYSLCEQRERARHVGVLLEAFSERDQEFVELYFAEGLEPEEVATRMKISIKTVYSKKHKIQSRLEAIVERAQMAA